MKNKANKPISHQDHDVAIATLLKELRDLIDHTKSAVSATVNAGLTILYWHVGERINAEILVGARGKYGAEIVSTLSRQLERDYGRGYSAKNVRHMMRFAEVFPEKEIVSALSRQLSWSHFKEIIYLKQPLQQDFYAELCRIELRGFGPCERRSTPCSTNAPPSPESPRKSSSMNWSNCANPTK